MCFRRWKKDLFFRGFWFVLKRSSGIFKSNVKNQLSKTNSISNLLETKSDRIPHEKNIQEAGPAD